MSWASRRRAVYASAVVIFAVVVVGIPIALALYRAPTCFDGKRNQGETAIDIGGPCAALDERSLESAAILWARAFPVRTGEYAATAYIKNPNRSAAALDVPYQFSFYDANNVLVAERFGIVSLMPGVITPVYEPQVTAGNRAIARTFFEFTDSPAWTTAGNPASALAESDIKITDIGSAPRLSVDVQNTDVESRTDIRYIATLFDVAGNAFASSQTVVSKLEGDGSKTIVFTWPSAFTAYPARIDVIPIIAPEVGE